MSWLSEFWRKITNTPKVPNELMAQKIVTRYLQVVGEGGGAEIIAGKGGVRITLSNPEKFKNHFSVMLKSDGSINMDFVGPDGKVSGALDMAVNGSFVPRLTPTPPSPPPVEPDPLIPEV